MSSASSSEENMPTPESGVVQILVLVPQYKTEHHLASEAIFPRNRDLIPRIPIHCTEQFDFDSAYAHERSYQYVQL